MPKANQWNKCVPRVEYDHRARDARLRFEQIERLLANRDAAMLSRYFRVLRLLGVNIARSARRRGQYTGSPSDRRPCPIAVPLPVS
jgi:hypothetical protein